MNWGTLAAALTLTLLVAGCGGNGSPTDGGPSDVGSDDAGRDGGSRDGGSDGGGSDGGGQADAGQEDAAVTPCDLVAQTGCEDGERCTWMTDGAGGGAAECVSDGTVGHLEVCTAREPGTPDDCVAGQACIGGVCQHICSTEQGCDADFVCTASMGFVDDETTGGCVPLCDPVTQERLFDDAPACASPNPSIPSQGCYLSGNNHYTCLFVGGGSSTRTHGMPASAPVDGSRPFFLNGCAPGYLPYWTPLIPAGRCLATCTPVETTMGNTSQIQGATPHNCPARGANTAECRFDYRFSLGDPEYSTPGLGICVDLDTFSYDHDENPQTDTVPWPSCGTLTSDDTNSDGVADHLFWGCAPTPIP